MIGVVSIGMTFVIIGGGIDLSVGAIVALASVWATTLATQTMAEDMHWIVMVLTALAVGAGCGLVNGAAHRLRHGSSPFIATLAMLAARPRPGRDHRQPAHPDRQRRPGFIDFFSGDVLGIPVLVIIFALVAVVGWVAAQPHHLRPPHLRRRRQPRGGPAGRHQRPAAHRAALRAGRRLPAASPRVMIMARTTTGSSTHGTLYELDAIAAVVIGGTLLSGGRGTIVGTVSAS